MGGSWALASLGVYLRDISQVIGVVITMLMFLSAIFYPVSSLPEDYQVIMQMNPLVPIIVGGGVGCSRVNRLDG